MSELVYGIHAIESLLKRDFKRFVSVDILYGPLNKRLSFLLEKLKRCDIPIQYRDRRFLNNKAQSVVHQGIIAKIRKTYLFKDQDILGLLDKLHNKKSCLLLILDNIMDPRNLGACLRCAGVFGVDIVIVSRRRSVGLSPVVWKVASGVADKIPFIRVTNLARTLQLLKEYNIWIVGTVLETMRKNIFQAKLYSSRLAVVMGSEESGIRFLTKRYCDELINIPSIADSLVSLNVSVATGICLYEILRQRIYYGY